MFSVGDGYYHVCSSLEQLLQLSEKLNAPHNIEHVADTLHQRLSDAVTTFQSNIDHLVTAVQHLQ